MFNLNSVKHDVYDNIYIYQKYCAEISLCNTTPNLHQTQGKTDKKPFLAKNYSETGQDINLSTYLKNNQNHTRILV